MQQVLFILILLSLLSCSQTNKHYDPDTNNERMNKVLDEHRTTIGEKSSIPKARNSDTHAVDHILFNSNHHGTNHEIYRMNADGSDLKQLTNDPRYDASWPRISPDRKRILFQRSPSGGKGGSDYKNMSLWMMNVDGSHPIELRPADKNGWAMQGHTEWHPNSRQLVLFGGPKRMNPQIYLADSKGNNFKAVTARSGQNLDPSFSPNGRYITFVGCPSFICFASNYEIYLIDSAGNKEAVRLTNDDLRDHDPYFSPDGKYIAWLTQSSSKGIAGSWGIRIARVGGNEETRWLIDDGNINSYPAFSPDGQFIYFHRLVYGGSQKGFHLYRIRTDGSGLKGVTTHLPGTQEYPNIF
jgi:TolB protein